MTVEDQQPASAQEQKPCIYYGFDLSKATFDYAPRRVGLEPIQPEGLYKIKTSKAKRTLEGIKQWWQEVSSTLEPGERVGVVMEVTSSFSLETAAWLKLVCPQVQLSILAGKRVRDWAQGIGIDDKDDDIDARVLGCYGAERQPGEYVPLDGIYGQIRPLTRARMALVEQRVAVKQQLEEAKSQHLETHISKLLQNSFNAVVRTLDKEIDKLEVQIKKLGQQDGQLWKDVELLDEIVGVGWITAVTILAELGDLRRFGKRTRLTSMAGLNPVLRKSGTSLNKKPRISKKGSSRARQALYLGVLSATKTGDNMFASMYERLLKAGKKKMQAAVAVMRKMLLVMRAVLISGKVLPAALSPKVRAKAEADSQA